MTRPNGSRQPLACGPARLSVLLGCAIVFFAQGILVAQTTPQTPAAYPLGPDLQVLAEDIDSPRYRKLVLQDMLSTDLAAEWQRVETRDSADRFLAEHGGAEKVLANPELKQAYEARVAIRDRFLDLMRDGFKRYKRAAPFDQGAKAELAGTSTSEIQDQAVRLTPVLPAPQSEKWWPRFRGPSGQGWTGLDKLPVAWSPDSKNIRWRSPVPGKGNSSPIIWDDHLFVTSAAPQGSERFLLAYRRSDGQQLWSRSVSGPATAESAIAKNGYASATPVTDGERVIAFFGAAGLVCYNFAGDVLWHYKDLDIDITHGPGSSPLLYQDLVILIQDQNRADSICLALDKTNGTLRWKQPRPKAMGWATPIVVRAGEHDELVYPGSGEVCSYEPTTGKQLWTLGGPTGEVVPSIVIGPRLLYSASGRNGPTLGFLPGGSGNVTKSKLVWRTVRGGPHVPSPIYWNGRLYTVNDTGIASCLNAETGELVWQARISDTFAASPIEAGGLLYFGAESGKTYLLRAGDRFEIVARNDIGAPLLASPAVADGRIYLRTPSELICLGD